MKKLLTIYTIFVYSVPVSVFFVLFNLLSLGEIDSSGFGLFIIPLLLMLLVCALVIANIANAIISSLRSKHGSFKTILLFKLCFIPFYLLNFIGWGGASMVFHLSFVVFPLLPFVIAYTYFTIVGTSAYNITKLSDLRRNKRISSKQFFFHSILQLIFVIDTIDSIYLAAKQKKFEKF